ncbi:MAG: hypothetical protein DI603_06855 [Roseateles depolymerans]|uniref:Uncharacterized protein n=1 Tax=Roseateles depolymerans TaxID=76731 RepID=A0A2W5DPJ3_9BURK|nr:MAG: hypothetical protein DI603_06855 [Roseateles depolymerans]
MKNTAMLLASVALAAIAAGPARAADVGVSISVGQPGFYGQIDIGTMRPQVIYPQPVLIQRVPSPPPPLYLRVPPGHEKNWAKHCAKYNACGRPVYFVKGDWYEREYVPRYRDGYDRDHGRWRDDDRDHDRDHGRGRGHDKGDDRGGHGRGHGNGNGRD